MGDVGDGGGAVSERGYGRQGDHGVGERVHVYVYAAESLWAAHFDGVGGYLDLAAHGAKEVSEAQVALRRGGAEVGDPYAPAGHRGGRHEVGRRGGVGLDLVVDGRVNGGVDREVV